MYFWVGLGNPGSRYTGTRHNIGADVLRRAQALEKELEVYFPGGFMNESGGFVAKIIRRRGIEKENLAVVHDELDLPFGVVRVSFGSGGAGHKGVESIIENLNTKKFWRVRIGIGNEGEENLRQVPAEKYVLKRFLPRQRSDLKKIIDSLSRLVLEWDSRKLETKTIKLI